MVGGNIMANKKIRIKPPVYVDGVATYPDVAHPETISDMVKHGDGTVETAIGAIEGDVGQLQTDMSTMQVGISTHLTASMPHQVQNLQTGKTYRYGLRVTAEGQPQIIYEEVV
jgi:hypothetical protein